MSLTGKPSLATAEPVVNDGFWVDLSLGDLMDKYRIPAEYENDTILLGVQMSLIRVNDKLIRARDAMIELGYITFTAYLTANPDPIDGKEKLQVHYEHAVYCRAKAFLLQQFNSLNRRNDAENAAKEADETEQYWLDESAQAIAAIMKVFFPLETFSGNANIHVALI